MDTVTTTSYTTILAGAESEFEALLDACQKEALKIEAELEKLIADADIKAKKDAANSSRNQALQAFQTAKQHHDVIAALAAKANAVQAAIDVAQLDLKEAEIITASLRHQRLVALYAELEIALNKILDKLRPALTAWGVPIIGEIADLKLKANYKGESVPTFTFSVWGRKTFKDDKERAKSYAQWQEARAKVEAEKQQILDKANQLQNSLKDAENASDALLARIVAAKKNAVEQIESNQRDAASLLPEAQKALQKKQAEAQSFFNRFFDAADLAS